MKAIIKINLLLVFVLIMAVELPAQENNVVTVEEVGVRFTVPAGWQYQASEEGYVFGHNSIAGLMVMSLNEFNSLEEIRAAVSQGFADEYGTNLQLNGSLEAFGERGLAGHFSGVIEGQPVKVYAVSLLHQYGGAGIDCMVVSTPEAFGSEQEEALKQLAGSVVFFKPENSKAKWWQDLFTYVDGCRLHYLTSSGGSDYGGGYSSSSDETIIDLCPDGRFTYWSAHDNTFDIPSGFGNARGRDRGAGKWSVGDVGGVAVLQLLFDDGRSLEYELSRKDNKTYLNGTRYFVLYDKAECN